MSTTDNSHALLEWMMAANRLSSFRCEMRREPDSVCQYGGAPLHPGALALPLSDIALGLHHHADHEGVRLRQALHLNAVPAKLMKSQGYGA